ncbi:MAG: ankyrin repeat domain-containing protein [Alphaproteobacteria bacterium]|nr:MAG: ankyrin repeat domain-containing protein [Alphaproteobacteria bacterium]
MSHNSMNGHCEEQGMVYRLVTRWIGLMLVAAAPLALFGAPAAAQFSDRYEFLKAIKDGDANAAISKLNSGIYPDVREADGTPALMVAATHGGMPWVALLLKHGADPDIANRSDGKTVLMYFAERGDVDSVKIMLGQGANVDAVDSLGETALIKAVRLRNLRVVQAILDANPRLDVQDSTGNTALDYAEYSRDRRIQKLLADAAGR